MAKRRCRLGVVKRGPRKGRCLKRRRRRAARTTVRESSRKTKRYARTLPMFR